jgi:hypothetical protein
VRSTGLEPATFQVYGLYNQYMSVLS